MTTINPQVEYLAHKQFKYADLFEKHAAELRKDPKLGQEAYDRVQRTWPLALGPEDQWNINDHNLKDYKNQFEEMCATSPETLDDHVKIMSAAFGMLNSITLHDMRTLTEDEQDQAGALFTKLMQVLDATLPPRTEFYISPRPFSDIESVRPGQRYFQEHDDDAETYLVRATHLDDEGNMRYTLQFEEDGELIKEFSKEEMSDILALSTLV
ncbi:hypothetical protein BOTBODRAFT_179300 [Botryobasidium botryosum FD-172 SS1]|uniref:Uncharacterized protein n=1 Tax=Botryobasidium botryosum (strain FD-172 SS1) TaxID=930990 RepID=A0A067M060_BOTB1|nr:hypothetical protein BOTBODRAFT_179300 [Botryobasidium botryosum FD-172 SS1]